MCTFVFKGDFYKKCGLLIAKQPHHLDRATSMVHSLLQGIEEKVTAVTKCVPFVSTNNCFFGQLVLLSCTSFAARCTAAVCGVNSFCPSQGSPSLASYTLYQHV